MILMETTVDTGCRWVGFSNMCLDLVYGGLQLNISTFSVLDLLELVELFHGRSGASDKTVLTSNASSSTTTATRNHYVPCGYPSFLRQPTPLKRICARVPTSWLYQYSELVRRNCTLGPCLLRQSTGGFVVESYSREVHETNVVQFSSQNCTLHVWSSLTFSLH